MGTARNACCVHNHRHHPDCTSVNSQRPKSGHTQTIIAGSFCRTEERRKTTNKAKQKHTKQQQQQQQQTNQHQQQQNNKEKNSHSAVQGVEPFATGSTIERVSNGPRRPVKCHVVPGGARGARAGRGQRGSLDGSGRRSNVFVGRWQCGQRGSLVPGRERS